MLETHDYKKWLRRCFDTWYTSLCLFCNSLIQDEQAAEDIVQQVFLYLWENRERLSRIESLEAYLYRSVRNRALNFNQSSSRKLNASLEAEHDMGHDSPIDGTLNANELEQLVYQALAQLGDKTRNVFVMRRMQGLSLKEISKKMEVSEKTVEYHISRSLKHLASFIRKHWEL